MRPPRLAILVFALALSPLCASAQTPAAPPTEPSPPAPAQPATLAAAVDTILTAQPAASRAHWGISVTDATTGATLYARNDAQLFEPASNAKLFTTAAALALLGPTYSMATRILAEGTLDAAGILHGDLRLIGGADPTLSGRVYPYSGHTDRSALPLAAFTALAAQVLASGIHSVDGPILADDTLFPDERYGAGWAWDDLQWEYGAPISALTINDNVRYLSVMPGAAAGLTGATIGEPVTAAWLPDLPGLPSGLQVTATTSAPGTAPSLGIARLPAGQSGPPEAQGTLHIYGSLPAGSAGAHLAIALEDPALYAGDALRAALAAAGIPVSGAVVPTHREPDDTQSFTAETHLPAVLHSLPPGVSSLAPALAGSTTRVVAARQSVPLSDIITVTNKISQNLHAELLLHLLGRAEGDDGSAAQGARVVRTFLTTQAGIAPDDFLLHDGSGLATTDLVTPRALTTLLRYSTTQPWGPILRNSLPASGVDGTLSSRFPTLRNRVQAKTGTLGEVDALSGFLTTNSGRTVIFSILCNNYPSPGSRAIVDALVEATAQAF